MSGVLDSTAVVYSPSCDDIKEVCQVNRVMGNSLRWAQIIKMEAAEEDCRIFVFDDYLTTPETNIDNVFLLIML